MEASSIINQSEAKLYFIQGPPGTGKSHTIVGILNAIFAQVQVKWKNPLKLQGEEKAHKTKILICSPSNRLFFYYI
jgi:hypothetical protein